ncbi:unnamed protein product [Cunninghamella blakesleeana]
MPKLTVEHINEYQTKGYTILLNALTEEEVDLLHEEADMFINHLLSEGYDLLQDFGGVIEPFNCGLLDPLPSTESQNRYKVNKSIYIDRRNQISPSVAQLLLNSIGSLAQSLLYGTLNNKSNDKTYLLNEQYIIKPPKTKNTSIFAWHRDSDYYQDISLRNEKTIACWIAVDSVNEENGTIYIKDPSSNENDHHHDEDSLAISIPAGSIVFMSSQLLHKSSGNASSKFRRVFMPQYSKKPLLDPQTSLPIALSVPINFYTD